MLLRPVLEDNHDHHQLNADIHHGIAGRTATCGVSPPKPESVRRNGVAVADRAEAQGRFFSKGRACLRAWPLVKQYGWGLRHDEQGRVAVRGVGTEEYREPV
jgi:Family of unknown function (DUF6157)